MKISCICGNVLRDQTDCIPYKARFIADQDYEDLVSEMARKLELIWDQNATAHTDTHLSEQLSKVLYVALMPYLRTLYQCNNCGRIFIDDPDEHRQLQIYKPENENWKKVFASVNGEETKRWGKNLVGHWDPSQTQGRLWFDPSPREKGGYETFDNWESFQKRYYELFKLLRSQNQLEGARLGVGNEGEPIQDIHNWFTH